jgi:hypothetical protein
MMTDGMITMHPQSQVGCALMLQTGMIRAIAKIFSNGVSDPSRSQNFLTAGSFSPLIFRVGSVLKQCCRSGSALIPIDFKLLDLNPDPFCKCGSGFRSKDIDQNKQTTLISSLSKRLLYLRRLWIWSQLDPHSFCCLGSESGSKSMEIGLN